MILDTKETLKKAGYCYAIKNGKKIKVETLSYSNKDRIIDEFFKKCGTKPLKIKDNYFVVDDVVFIFKFFLRDHTNPRNNTSDVNENEKFRTRYSKENIEMFKEIEKKYGVNAYIVSVYDAGDKFLYWISNFKSIIYRTKDEIKSDTRVLSFNIEWIEKCYLSKGLQFASLPNIKTTTKDIYYFNSEHSDSFWKELWSGELSFNDSDVYEKLVGDFSNTPDKWLEASREKITHLKLEMNTIIGEIGEYFAFHILRMKFGKENVIWTSKENAFSPFDIVVITENGNIFFEVKTSKNDFETFIISDNEKKFMDEKKDDWKLIKINLKTLEIDESNVKNALTLIEKKMSNDTMDDLFKFYSYEQVKKWNFTSIGYRVKEGN